jgi:hypothetical protein
MSGRDRPGAEGSAARAERMPLLERLGLHRRELRAWAMYEWATTGMWAVVVATVFPIYYQSVAAAGLPGPVAIRNFAFATTLGIVLVAATAFGFAGIETHEVRCDRAECGYAGSRLYDPNEFLR